MMRATLKSRKRLSSDARRLINTTTIALSLAFAYSLFTHILIPATHSVNPRVLYRAGEQATQQNDYVKFQRTDDYLPDGKAWLVKRLGCVAGQYLSVLAISSIAMANKLRRSCCAIPTAKVS